MKHFASPSFWELYEKLPPAVRDTADKNFAHLKTNSKHPSLHLKKVGSYWSARAGKKYRALGIDVDEGILWFWIDPHAEYEKLLA